MREGGTATPSITAEEKETRTHNADEVQRLQQLQLTSPRTHNTIRHRFLAATLSDMNRY